MFTAVKLRPYSLYDQYGRGPFPFEFFDNTRDWVKVHLTPDKTVALHYTEVIFCV